MDFFEAHPDGAYCEGVPLEKIAREVGTPAYVYSMATLDRHCVQLKKALGSFPCMSCFAVKANSNLSVLKRIFSHGLGADVVSVGEMERALLAGASPSDIVFSGVGKREDELVRALDVGIFSFNVESEGELNKLVRLANREKKHARLSLRINPNVDAQTNPYISTGLYTTKFGIVEPDVAPMLEILKDQSYVDFVGISCHIGSQIVNLGPFEDAARRMVELAGQYRSSGFPLEFIDLGGGLGIRYKDEDPPTLAAYIKTLKRVLGPTGLALIIEPGRVISGNIGVLLTSVLGVKKTPKKEFVIVDAAMNDLIRPSIYQSYHEISPVKPPESNHKIPVDVVGPICETGDFLGLDRLLPPLAEGDLLYVSGCGAYAATMASNYNSRPRAPEVLVDGDEYTVIRKRETLEDLWQLELTE